MFLILKNNKNRRNMITKNNNWSVMNGTFKYSKGFKLMIDADDC